LLPKSIEILLLSVGPDSHIASLFPGSNILLEKSRSVVSIVCPKPPLEGLVVTPRVIRSAKSTILFARGKEKRRILAQALESPNDIASLSVRLIHGYTWMLDFDVAEKSKISLKIKSNFKLQKVLISGNTTCPRSYSFLYLKRAKK